MDTEQQLIHDALAIGAIADSPHWVSAGLAAAIQATGHDVRSLTVGELLDLIERQRERIAAGLVHQQ